MLLGLSGVVLAPLLMGIVGGHDVPILRWVGVVGCIAPTLAVPPASMAAVVSRMCSTAAGGRFCPCWMYCGGVCLLHCVVLLVVSDRAVDVLVPVYLAQVIL